MTKDRNNTDPALDKWLECRLASQPSQDFAESIIRLARQTPQSAPQSLWEWIRRVYEDLMLPSPAYVFACTLIIGMAIGALMDTQISTTTHISTAQLWSDDEGELL